MISILALTMGGPLMILFGILVAGAVGCAGGYVLGTSIGRTRPETPLPTTIRIARDALAATCTDIEKASRALGEARQAEAAGRALLLAERICELSSQLGRHGRKAKHEEASA